MRRSVARGAIGAAVLLLTAGCGGGSPSQTHNVRIDVGGLVYYEYDFDLKLAGVSVTIVDADGETRTATTNDDGLWRIDDLPPGVYSETFALAGYEPQTRRFTLEANGENDIRNAFIERPPVVLDEERMRGAFAPFGVAVASGDTLTDGFEGVTAVYSTSAATSIVVTLSHPVGGAGVAMGDGVTGAVLDGTPDASMMVWTFDAADIMTINQGITPANPGLRTDQDPYTWHGITWSAFRYTPIHGRGQYEGGTLYFNATP